MFMEKTEPKNCRSRLWGILVVLMIALTSPEAAIAQLINLSLESDAGTDPNQFVDPNKDGACGLIMSGLCLWCPVSPACNYSPEIPECQCRQMLCDECPPAEAPAGNCFVTTCSPNSVAIVVQQYIEVAYDIEMSPPIDHFELGEGEEDFDSSHRIEGIQIEIRKMQYLGVAEEEHVFLDIESSEDYTLGGDVLQNILDFLVEGESYTLLIIEDQIVGLDPLEIVIPEVTESAPAIRVGNPRRAEAVVTYTAADGDDSYRALTAGDGHGGRAQGTMEPQDLQGLQADPGPKSDKGETEEPGSAGQYSPSQNGDMCGTGLSIVMMSLMFLGLVGIKIRRHRY